MSTCGTSALSAGSYLERLLNIAQHYRACAKVTLISLPSNYVLFSSDAEGYGPLAEVLTYDEKQDLFDILSLSWEEDFVSGKLHFMAPD